MKLAFMFLLVSFTYSFSQVPTKREMVTLNGSDIYYEVYGKGDPLFLLHGFTQSSKSWLPFVADYASEFEVYLVDLRGHGKSRQFKETLSIKAAAGDVDALIKHLKLENINAIGLSYGGDVLFQIELLHPGLIKSMISIGACGSWNADDYPDWVEYLSYKNIDNLPWMKEQQTSDAHSKSILDQMINYKVEVSESDLKTIKAKTLLVIGDGDDSIPLTEVARVRKNLPTFIPLGCTQCRSYRPSRYKQDRVCQTFKRIL